MESLEAKHSRHSSTDFVPTVQPLRSVQAPSLILPRVAGEERGGGLNCWNDWNSTNKED